jgi:protease-4
MGQRGGCIASSGALVLLGVVLLPGCVFISGNLNPFSREPQPLREHVVAGHGDAKILLIDVTRVISNESERGVFGLSGQESVVARVEAELRQAAGDDAIAGLVVRINTPGGTVTASDVLYERFTRFRRERRVPIVAQLMDVAASGGYYTALAADEIIAHPTTVTGSVGVIFQGLNFEGLMDKIGVRNQTIKSGDKKDIGSPLRKMTADERALLEGVLGEMRSRFVGLVRERRPAVGDAQEKIVADGRILTAAQALDLGLVDRIGYLDDAIVRTKLRAGVSDARIVIYRRPDEFAETLYSSLGSRAASPGTQINLINFDVDGLMRSPQFLYLWAP